MKILTSEDQVIDTNDVSSEETVEYYYNILDFTKMKYPDFYCKPLVFVNTYTDSAAHLSIGEFDLILPFRWSILILNGSALEYISIEDLTGRVMTACVFNPLSSFRPETRPVRVNTISYTASFSTPNLERKNLLVVPIDGKKTKPLCIMAGENNCKIPENLSINDILD